MAYHMYIYYVSVVIIIKPGNRQPKFVILEFDKTQHALSTATGTILGWIAGKRPNAKKGDNKKSKTYQRHQQPIYTRQEYSQKHAELVVKCFKRMLAVDSGSNLRAANGL